MKKIYASGPFGHLYKIELNDTFLKRCMNIRNMLKALKLKDDERIELYKVVDGRFHRTCAAKITPEQITIGVWWEEGWDDFFWKESIENLPKVYFCQHVRWTIMNQDEVISSNYSVKDVDKEDIPYLVLEEL